MNKKIRSLIVFTIVSTSFTTWIPSVINMGGQCAYAYSSDEISSLKITSGSLDIPVSIYSSITHKEAYRVKAGDKVPTTVYSKISSDKSYIKLNTIETTSQNIRVFVGKEMDKLADIHSQINIAQGEKKTIYIRLYNSQNDTDDNYLSEYELIVEREVDTDEDDADDTITLKNYDDIYLTQLKLSNDDNKIDFNFDKTQPIYNINVDENVSYVRIKAVPEQESYKLLINDKEVDTKGSNKNIRTEMLDEGKNLIKIRIISSDHERREYFLNITKSGNKSNLPNNNTTTNESSNTPPENGSSQNIQTGGTWQYKKADGTLATGWTCIDNEWYYFDENGAMKTGWLKDNSGKWYYLNSSGIMAKSTIINGYKIGLDGAYIS